MMDLGLSTSPNKNDVLFDYILRRKVKKKQVDLKANIGANIRAADAY